MLSAVVDIGPAKTLNRFLEIWSFGPGDCHGSKQQELVLFLDWKRTWLVHFLLHFPSTSSVAILDVSLPSDISNDMRAASCQYSSASLTVICLLTVIQSGVYNCNANSDPFPCTLSSQASFQDLRASFFSELPLQFFWVTLTACTPFSFVLQLSVWRLWVPKDWQWLFLLCHHPLRLPAQRFIHNVNSVKVCWMLYLTTTRTNLNISQLEQKL